MALAPDVRAATTTVVQSFAGSDGAFPNAGLTAGSGGVLYGTATTGGPSEDLSVGGVAFSLTPNTGGGGWTRTVLHLFGRTPTDGQSPHSRLVAGRDGALYGTTTIGGLGNQGTVYRLIPPSPPSGAEWQEQVLYRFSGLADGGYPLSDVVFDASGRLYGTTSLGGTLNMGTVWRLSPPLSGTGTWTLKQIHSFAGPDGSSPRAGLLARHVAGVFTLFGTTATGGAHGQGSVFSIALPGLSAPSASFSTIYSFAGGSDGGVPVGGLAADEALNLYGTATQGGAAPLAAGGGVVFKLLPPTTNGTPWTELVLHSFAGGADGRFPLGTPLLQPGGRLVGTSAGSTYGGCTADCGTAFMLTSRGGGLGSPWGEVVLHGFSGPDGDLPSAGLAAVQDSGGTVSFYGVTERGGAGNIGTVFKVTP